MPNWCNNNLTVEGNSLATFNRILKDKPFTIGAFFPIPLELVNTTSPNPSPESKDSKALTKKFGFDNWYDWCIANWGTKWDVDAETITSGKKHTSFGFDSAWAPPIKAIAAISKMFPKLTFTLSYAEFGMMYAGQAIIKNGEVDDDCTEDENSTTWRNIAVDMFGFEPMEDAEETE